MKNIELVFNQTIFTDRRMESKIQWILDDYLNKVKINQDSMGLKDIISVMYVYAEIYDDLLEKDKWNSIIKQQLIIVKTAIEKDNLNGLALFGGLSDIALSVYLYSKKTGQYIKFYNDIDELIIDALQGIINAYMSENGNLKMQHYDSITGMSGVLVYLISTDRGNHKKLIEKILTYLVKLTEKKRINGVEVPGWYIKRENQFREDERKRFKKGNFNFGLAHGIAGPLAAMALAYQCKYQVEGQKEAIERIIQEYKELASYDKGYVIWPGQYSFEDYILKEKKFLNNDNRMSWCYGSIGILRALKLGAKALENEGLLEWNKLQVDRIIQMPVDRYLLESPIICHGYAGMLALFLLEFKELPRQILKEKIIELTNTIIEAYDSSLIFGFKNTETIYENGTMKKTDSYQNGFLDGAGGCILSLLSVIKENTTWEIHLLAKTIYSNN